MDRATWVRTGLAGAVAGAGLAVGGVAIATADSETNETTAAHHGPRRGGGPIASALAEELGLKTSDVRKALLAVRDELRPERSENGERPAPPTDEERAERRAALAAALADELDVSAAKIEAALEKLAAAAEEQRTERRADMRAKLVERLDAAVEDGTLTEADKASVLKAFDAQVIGAGPRGGPGGPGDPGGPGVGPDAGPDGAGSGTES